MSRLEVVCVVFGWKKATWEDVSREMETPIEELLEYNDSDFLEIILYYANSVRSLS